MNRRNFLKMGGGLGLARAIPVGFPLSLLARRARAFSPDYGAVGYTPPTVMPQVINIFLYGGPSELAGNLTNIADIDANSQNSYTEAFGDGILDFTTDGGQITPHGFWQDAGGAHMEDMIAGGDLSVYRTLVKRKNATRSHRESIFIANKGALAVENSPGVGTRLAGLLHTHRDRVATASLADGTAVSSFDGGLPGMPLPFVSFEGESTSYAIDPDKQLPLALRPITMNRDFDNPYSRGQTNATNEAVFERLRGTVMAEAGYRERFEAAANGFEHRRTMEDLIGRLETARDEALPNVGTADPDGDDTTGELQYPNNGFAENVRAAVTLAIANPSTVYITAGSDGLGGWDDHNNGVDKYPGRMNDVMDTLRVAMRHIRLSSTGSRPTDNIVINVFGDFGRLVNLNNSMGWDHANNQNLYTLGGAALRPSGALGKVVGATERVGTAGENNQYTMPTDGSYEAEPMAVASTVYGYFGAQRPEAMTADPERNPSGDAPIDETRAGEPTLF
ncbi:DUF1501 domain-containing protein [Thiohalorhabdus sp. Cl-TMA]|uniref:DUF1501 domain-containing protein n=1 Tax=Thiohalorhabdus methylotrophus TaxID=3242694 RepID=A0ABV4U045_9GAMM